MKVDTPKTKKKNPQKKVKGGLHRRRTYILPKKSFERKK